MNTIEIFKIRAELNSLGVPTKSITILKVIHENPGITTTELGEKANMSKQAASKHVTPLENKGIITNSHPHPLYKAWTIKETRIQELLTQLP